MLFIYKVQILPTALKIDKNSIIYFLLVLFWAVPLETGSGMMSNRLELYLLVITFIRSF